MPSYEVCKNVVVSKQVNNTVAVGHFSISKKAQLPAIRITEQPLVINFLSTFAKNCQSKLVLVLVLVLESKGP